MSSHKETGMVIPKRLINKLKIYVKNVLQGFHNKRQLLFGLYDLTVHLNNDLDPLELWKEKEVSILKDEYVESIYFISSFGHLMGGYDAGYYFI